jgi:hypothetical protein
MAFFWLAISISEFLLPPSSGCLYSYDEKKVVMEWSEMLINLYQTTRRCNPQECHLLTHRRENFKSYILILFLEDIFYINGDLEFVLIFLAGP